MVAVNTATCTVVSCAMHLRMPARLSDTSERGYEDMRLLQCREATMVADDVAPCTAISCALHLRQQLSCHACRRDHGGPRLPNAAHLFSGDVMHIPATVSNLK